ncbi:MAG: hypothetical protein ACRDWA_16040 [Acidimicrobiia bacterium]
MKYRIPLAAAAVTLLLLVTGLAWADDSTGSGNSSTTSTTSTSSTSTSSTMASSSVTNSTVTSPTTTAASASPALATIPDGTSRTFVVENAGTVLVGRSGNSLQIIAATPNAGWSSEVEVASGREVEGDFRRGGVRVKYNFELEDGTVRIRIEVRDNDGDDDALDDDDNSGPGSGDDDGADGEDNSGSGSGRDDNSGSSHGDDDDHDNSGPGDGDDDDSDDND